MEKEKKKWETPKLVCLYRGGPEEGVLQVCKIATQGPHASQHCNHPNQCSVIIAT